MKHNNKKYKKTIIIMVINILCFLYFLFSVLSGIIR